GICSVPSTLEAFTVTAASFKPAIWLCGGIFGTSKVLFSVPDISPNVLLDNPGPCPGPNGTLPLRSGNAKVVTPSPPYWVPNSENKAEFCDIANNRPSHAMNPRGMKFPANNLITAKYSSIYVFFGKK